VLAALADAAVVVEEVLVARTASLADVVARAADQRVPVRHVAADKVGRMSGRPRDDQGVVAVVRRPIAPALTSWSPGAAASALVLDGVTNPANVGMILRSAVAFGVGAVALPRVGAPELGPLVVKASAGVALSAPVYRCETAADGVRWLRAAGFRVLGLRADAAASLWQVPLEGRVAFVLGSETEGLSPAVAAELDEAVSIPMSGGVESLNVAVAAAVVCYELARRRQAHT
jgi:23S rRNA (guanosine2251-2'-O)-methyltransferase